MSYVLEHIERFSMDGRCRKKARSLSLDWAKCPSGMQDLFKTYVHPTPGSLKQRFLSQKLQIPRGLRGDHHGVHPSPLASLTKFQTLCCQNRDAVQKLTSRVCVDRKIRRNICMLRFSSSFKTQLVFWPKGTGPPILPKGMPWESGNGHPTSCWQLLKICSQACTLLMASPTGWKP